MSNKYINAAINQAPSIKDPAAAHILLVLANRADPHGICFPPHESIAADTGYSLATVKRKLTLLKRQGQLQWTTIRNSQGRNIGNRYRLTPATAQGELWSTAHPVPKTAPATAHPVTQPQLTVSCENPQLEETPNRKRKPPIERDAPSALALDDAPLHMNGFAKEAKASGCPTRKEASKQASKRDRAHPLPPEWAPSASHEALGQELGFSSEDIWGMAAAMREHWQANAHLAASRKSDWDAAFNGWIRRECDYRKRRSYVRPHEQTYPEIASELYLRSDEENGLPPGTSEREAAAEHARAQTAWLDEIEARMAGGQR